MKQTLVWLRRDLRLKDNKALSAAMKSSHPIQVLFIFDDNILDELPKNDPRVQFIHQNLEKIHAQLREKGSSLLIKKGEPINIFKELFQENQTAEIHFNEDFEPYALQRDMKVKELCKQYGISCKSHLDHLVFHPKEVLKDDGTPYTVFTPYSKKWKLAFQHEHIGPNSEDQVWDNFFKSDYHFPSLKQLGFEASPIQVRPYTLDHLGTYANTRDIPSLDAGSYLSPHLRFGTVSIRSIISIAHEQNESFLNELIWREFFTQILYHFPNVVKDNFRVKYDNLKWRNNEQEFELWKQGKTGYPLVDAGMRELNQTGYMHNRVRMVTASFLCKHLLIDWRWGEAYFAEKLLDYELSSNNGNWQWAASTGCDAQPYFRIFNPHSQLKRFDPKLAYCKKHIANLEELSYPAEMVDHKFARERCLAAFKAV